MKQHWNVIVVLWMVWTVGLFAQDITFSSNPLNFGSISLGTPVTRSLTITNPNGYNLQLELSTTNPVFVPSTSTMTIPAGQTADVTVTCTGATNVAYQGLFIAADDSHSLARSVTLSAQCHDSDSYYDQTYNLYDNTLKSTLHNMIDNQDALSYTGAKQQMFGYIDNVNGQVQCVYTGVWYAVAYGGMPDQDVFNTEHTWAQSRFEGISEENIAKADLHHLFPTFADINNTRANLPFGDVTDIDGSDGGSTWGYTDEDLHAFDPRDPHKGDCARAMFYFSIRYNNPTSFLNEQEEDLRAWSHDDPVSTYESQRNDAIDDVQHNRNPFVDRPALLDRIYSVSTTATCPTSPDMVAPLDDFVFGSVLPQTSATRQFLLVNEGTGTLTLTSVAINNTHFSVGSYNSSLPAQSAELIPISFNGAEVGTYSAVLTITGNDGSLAVPIAITVSTTSTDDETVVPGLLVGPNPFNPARGGVKFSNKATGMTHYAVYNLRGELLREWRSDQAITWNGTDRNGRVLSQGIYLLRVDDGRRQTCCRLVLVK